MEMALEQARTGLECGEVPVGCVIVHNNSSLTVVARSHNLTC